MGTKPLSDRPARATKPLASIPDGPRKKTTGRLVARIPEPDDQPEFVSLTIRAVPTTLRDRLTRVADREQVLMRDLARYLLERGLEEVEAKGLPERKRISPVTRFRLYED